MQPSPSSHGPRARRTWRTPGCAGWGLLVLVSFVVMVLPAALIYSVTDWLWQLPVLVALGALALSRLWRRATTRVIPICPLCGVDTDPGFRVCRSCGRVKN